MKQMRVSRSCATRWLRPHHVEVAEVDAPLRQRLVELHHQRLVLRADRAGSSPSVPFLQRPRADVLRRIGADRGRRQSRPRRRSAPCSTTRASSAISRSGDASSGLMSISLIQRCSTTSWLKRTSSCSSAARSTGARPRTPLQRREDPGLLHHPPRQRRVERRQRRARGPEDLDQLAARAEQQHRAELRIERCCRRSARSRRRLIIGCTVTPWKCSRAAPCRSPTSRIASIGPAHRRRRSPGSAARRRHRSCA